MEIGGGNGTLCLDVLSFFKREHPELYEDMTYTIIEVSERLSQRQRERADESGHGDKITIINESILEWDRSDFHDKHCYFLAVEVLDNMPHDKVVSTKQDEHFQTHVWRNPALLENMKTGEMDLITFATTNLYTESYEELTDPLIIECMHHLATAPQPPIQKYAFLRYGFGGFNLQVQQKLRTVLKMFGFEDELDPYWVPTGQLQFIKTLRDHFPSHDLFVSDFEVLPVSQSIPGHNAPVVSRRQPNGKSRDYDTYLNRLGEADIFFPSDFGLFQHTYNRVCGKEVSVLAHMDFMMHFTDVAKGQTKSGFNVFLGDYINFACAGSGIQDLPELKAKDFGAPSEVPVKL